MKEKELTVEAIFHEYNVNDKSFGEIAREFGTYPNKIKRMFTKAGGKSRTKSEAQKVALKDGRSKHPTLGRTRSVEEKLKISESVAKSWDELSEEELQKRREVSRQQWDRMSEADKQELLKKARDGAREAAITGSKLELVLRDALEAEGYRVEFHKDDLLENPRLQIDMYVPECATVIEVDGLSHFEPIWGEENYSKNKRADEQKNGILLSYGVCVIRLINKHKHMSARIERDAIDGVLESLGKIKKKFPAKHHRLIEIEV